MSKKSETIEIRVSHAMKLALSRAAEARGETMSGLVRTLVEDHCTGALPAVGPTTHQGWTLMKTLTYTTASALGATTLAVLLTAISPAAAQLPGLDMFEEADLNGDGIMARAEYDHILRGHMLMAVGSEAALWPAACQGTPPATPAAAANDAAPHEAGEDAGEDFAALDLNGDGQVTVEEFRESTLTRLRAEFATLDKDGTGTVTPGEWQAAADVPVIGSEPGAEEALSPDCLTALEQAGLADERSGQADAYKGDIAKAMSAADLDGDGALSFAEFVYM